MRKFWNRILHFCALVLALILIGQWFEAINHYGWFWPKVGIILLGWWLAGVWYSFMYEGETKNWTSIGSDATPMFGPIALLSYLANKITSADEWTWRFLPDCLLGPAKLLVTYCVLYASITFNGIGLDNPPDYNDLSEGEDKKEEP